MNDMLKTLFWDNPYLPEKVEHFCAALPGYLEAKQSYDAVARQMLEASGFDLYDQFERSLFRYTEYEVRAYYLFGLGLRQEILESLKDAV